MLLAWGRNRSCGCAAGATRTVATGELERYAFPTLLFWGPGSEYMVSGRGPLTAYLEAMAQPALGSTAAPCSAPIPNEAFARWARLTTAELDSFWGPTPGPYLAPNPTTGSRHCLPHGVLQKRIRDAH